MEQRKVLMPHYVDVTEAAGDEVSQEQVARAVRRYAWASQLCQGKDVVEVACGTGPGLGLLLKSARSLHAGDISDAMIKRASQHYGSRVRLQQMDAQELPFPSGTLDVVILFEALYYVPDPEKFARESARVLRPGGLVLISNANKDLFDFNPSPYSHIYHGVVELGQLFTRHGFSTTFWGDTPIDEVSLRQKILRPVKKLAVISGLMPSTMRGKKLLKRLVFGRMEHFPKEITQQMIEPFKLSEVPATIPDRSHKVILCLARKR